MASAVQASHCFVGRPLLTHESSMLRHVCWLRSRNGCRSKQPCAASSIHINEKPLLACAPSPIQRLCLAQTHAVASCVSWSSQQVLASGYSESKCLLRSRLLVMQRGPDPE